LTNKPLNHHFQSEKKNAKENEMKSMVEIRHYLHQNPELSDNEMKTSHFLKQILQDFSPQKIVDKLGGYGLLAIYRGQRPGKNILLRADLDALPIAEDAALSYKSLQPNVAHLCGHDGHMTILLEVAKRLHNLHGNFAGNAILLFQPAEETGQGAKRVLADPKFQQIPIDYAFGLHNLPGFELGQVIVREQTFASASQGLIIRLQGASSHAGHPENGNNPVFAMLEIVQELEQISQQFQQMSQRGLITIIHLKLGEVAFGTAPGEGVVMATFRAYRDAEMQQMTTQAQQLIQRICHKYQLKYQLEWVEKFLATVNDDFAVQQIKKAAETLQFSPKIPATPFAWSEDFSYISQKFPSGFFGLGAGKESPQLHNSNYDFPDQLIDLGAAMFMQIITNMELKT
jgi:amidohydrolase